jgi:hypothetical protein
MRASSLRLFSSTNNKTKDFSTAIHIMDSTRHFVEELVAAHVSNPKYKARRAKPIVMPNASFSQDAVPCACNDTVCLALKDQAYEQAHLDGMNGIHGEGRPASDSVGAQPIPAGCSDGYNFPNNHQVTASESLRAPGTSTDLPVELQMARCNGAPCPRAGPGNTFQNMSEISKILGFVDGLKSASDPKNPLYDTAAPNVLSRRDLSGYRS